MNYGYTLEKRFGYWILILDHNEPMYFKRAYEAIRIITSLQLHVRPEHGIMVA